MKNLVLLIVFSFSFASCATIFNGKTVSIKVYADTDSTIVCVNDTSECYLAPVKLELPRLRDDITLIVKKDTVERNVVLSSRLSGMYIFGNYCSPYWAGYLIDLTNPKRFSYSRNNYITLANDSEKPQKWIPPVKDQINFKLSVPMLAQFYLLKKYGYGSAVSLPGLSVGMEYYILDDYSLSFDLGGIARFPDPLFCNCTYERTEAAYFDIQIGKEYNRFHGDLGLQVNTTFHTMRRQGGWWDYGDIELFRRHQVNAGLAFSGYYRFNNATSFGVNYYPTVFDVTERLPYTNYSHLFMAELVFKIQTYRPLNYRAIERGMMNN